MRGVTLLASLLECSEMLFNLSGLKWNKESKTLDLIMTGFFFGCCFFFLNSFLGKVLFTKGVKQGRSRHRILGRLRIHMILSINSLAECTRSSDLLRFWWKWKWKWSHSVVSDSLRPHGLSPTRLLSLWDFPGKSTGLGCQGHLKDRFWSIKKD